ncbi:MAG: sodium:solute symporter [candidate division KSB1 bacterium]|nr:sodium:solute symporter [candidate division KSB1 bacterium]
MGFSTIDYALLLVYLAAVACFGIWAGRRQRDVRDYFLGGRSIPWPAVCFSVVAAETSTLTFISIPGLAYMTNLSFLQVTFGYLIGRVVVSLVLLPAYARGEVSTAYAFLEARFGAKTRRFASLVFLFTRLAADGVRLFATAIPLKFILKVDYPVAIAILAAVAFAYTFAGGVRSVIWIDTVQMFIYIGGALATAAIIVGHSKGTLGELFYALLSQGKLHIFDLGFGKGFLQKAYTLPAGLIGGALLSMASHGTDQLIVQRILTTKSLADGRKALVGTGVLVIAQFALFLLVGALLYAHYAGASLATLGLTRSDEVFPYFIVQGLPSGVAGLVIAGLLAAALSTLAGSMSSMASSVVFDLWRPAEVSARTRGGVRAGRVATAGAALMLVLSALLFMSSTRAVVETALSIASFTYGGLLGTFLLGLLVHEATQEDALAGFVAGILVMVTVISLKLVAWTWYTMIGVLTTLALGKLLTWLKGEKTIQQPPTKGTSQGTMSA